MRHAPIFLILLLLTSCSPSNAQTEDSNGYCFGEAGQQFGIQPELLQAISYVESRHNPQALHENVNGTLDYGHMQINSTWVSKIGQTYMALDDPCYCTKIGAWILSDCINSYGYNIDAISCYNSGKPLHRLSGQTRERVEGYIGRVKKRYKEITGRK